MLILTLALAGALAHAGPWFPPDFPPDDGARVEDILHQYLQNRSPVLDQPPRTPDDRVNQLYADGTAAGLVVGLRQNHARLSPDTRRITLFTIGTLFLRAIIDHAAKGRPTEAGHHGVGQFPLGSQSAYWRPVGHDAKVRRELRRLLEPASTLLNAVAEGHFLEDLRPDGARYRDEAVETVRRILLRVTPYRHVLVAPDERHIFTRLLHNLGGPRRDEITAAVACLNAFKAGDD